MSTHAGKIIQQFGLSELYSSPDPLVDVIFVHGLNGHPRQTWTSSKPDVLWPADLLPDTLKEQRCRILTYGYDANVTAFTDGVSKDKIHNHAEQLASRLVANRALKKAQERPIIFVCHSLGGLVVKRCLIYCESIHHQHTERLRSIYVSTYGVLFFGTPHNGSDLAKWGTILESICAAVLPKKFFDSSGHLVQALQNNNETLQNINRMFSGMISRYHIYFFYESRPTDLKATKHNVVDIESAAPVIDGCERMGIERDHSTMCKFEDENAPGYDVVAEAIQRYATDAPNVVLRRWEEEKRLRELQLQGQVEEVLGIYNPPMSPISTAVNSPRASQPVSLGNSISSIKLLPYIPIETLPPVVGPLHFRPNTLFFGFQIELDQLHLKLNNSKKQDMGTCSVLIWGPPGCGKSHLARQYLWQHRTEYSAGVYWVDCKSKASREKGFWEIAQNSAIGVLEEPDSQTDASTTFVDTVRKWFEARRRWLIVFDGITLDNDDDIQDFRRFLPDSKDIKGNNIIYTSVDQTLARRQRLLDPASIKVHPLSQEEACNLLFESMDLKKPNKLQMKKAVELVKHYDCLPLAVHAAAHLLEVRGRSLEKYTPGTSDQRLAEPYHEIMATLREHSHIEAVNLVTLLSFFNHNVPVALLQFGRPALTEYGIEIQALQGPDTTKRELENTIAVLRRYGLIERTLLSYSVTSTQNGSASPEEVRSRKTVGDVPSSSRKSLTDAGELMFKHDIVNDNDPRSPAHPDSQVERSSSGSVSYSIDILRIHTVIQEVLREELKSRSLNEAQPFFWWLTIASRLLCRSYNVANAKIRATGRQGLVRDYREYDTHAARLWSLYPKSSEDAPRALRRARHDLHQIRRSIDEEIQSRSPSHASASLSRQMPTSIFDRSSSTSDEAPDTPKSGLSRKSTWSIEPTLTKSESPTDMPAEDFFDHPLYKQDSMDQGYMADAENIRPNKTLPHSRRSSASDATEIRFGSPPNSRPPSIAQTVFQARPNLIKKPKDLGEWKALPAPPILDHGEISSSTETRIGRPQSAGSEAEAALAAVRQSTLSPPRIGRLGSHGRSETSEEKPRTPFSELPVNVPTSPVTIEYRTNPTNRHRAQSESPKHSRNPSASPRLIQSLLYGKSASNAGKALPPLPKDQSPYRSFIRLPTFFSFSTQRNISEERDRDPDIIPRGYTSQPMSRDNSKESNISLATAPPAVPGSASLSASPQIREPYLYSRPGPASIDVVNAGLNFRNLGDWGDNSPDTLASLDNIDVTNIPNDGSVQFGLMDPITINAARARAWEARARSSDRRE